MLKHDIRQYTISFSKYFASQKRNKIQILKNKLKVAHKKLAIINLSADNAIQIIQCTNEKIDNISAELNKYTLEETQGTMLCSKTRYMTLGEHCTKYFFGLEKANARSKTMTATMTEKGDITHDSKEILEIQSKFYKKLYTKDQNIKCELNEPPPVRLSGENSQKLETALTLEELQQAVCTTAQNKSPGTSGFQINLYIVFWTKLKNFLLDAFNFAFANGRLSIQQREGIITLIPKRDRNLNYVCNWRPIVLLNSDYKLLSKVIANRIKAVWQELIHPDQNGFISGQSASDSVRKVLNGVEYVNEKNLAAVLILVDFEKAFDRVNYDSMYEILKWFNFGPDLIKWVRLLFTDYRLATINNGYTSEYFSPTRGLFQGNPIASIIFNCVIELLAIQIRKNSKIKGITIGTHEILLTLFADDLSMLMEFTESSWNEATHEFSDFEQKTGMLINYDKSQIYRLGSIQNTNAKFYSHRKLVWTNTPVNLLGIIIANSQQETYNANVEPLINKAQIILKRWSLRDLSILGKIQVINSLVASIFLYRLAVISCLTAAHAKQIKEIFQNFVWNGKHPKIKYEILVGLKSDGGAGMADILCQDKAQKISWIYKVMKNSNLKEEAYCLMNNPVGDKLWELAIDPNEIDRVVKPTSDFWYQTLKESGINAKFKVKFVNVSTVPWETMQKRILWKKDDMFSTLKVVEDPDSCWVNDFC